MSGDKNQLRSTPGDDTIEGAYKRFNLGFPSVEFLRDQQSVGQVVRAEREAIDVTSQLPFGKASPQINFEGCGGLVAFLGILRKELQDDRGQRLGHLGIRWRRWLTCDVTVD